MKTKYNLLKIILVTFILCNNIENDAMVNSENMECIDDNFSDEFFKQIVEDLCLNIGQIKLNKDKLFISSDQKLSEFFCCIKSIEIKNYFKLIQNINNFSKIFALNNLVGLYSAKNCDETLLNNNFTKFYNDYLSNENIKTKVENLENELLSIINKLANKQKLSIESSVECLRDFKKATDLYLNILKVCLINNISPDIIKNATQTDKTLLNNNIKYLKKYKQFFNEKFNINYKWCCFIKNNPKYSIRINSCEYIIDIGIYIINRKFEIFKDKLKKFKNINKFKKYITNFQKKIVYKVLLHGEIEKSTSGISNNFINFKRTIIKKFERWHLITPSIPYDERGFIESVKAYNKIKKTSCYTKKVKYIGLFLVQTL